VNQLTKHREKQHPGFVAPLDGGPRRRRQSPNVPPTAAQPHGRCYPEDLVNGLPPTVLQQAVASTGPPSLPDELTARNAATMLPWTMPPWSPFNFLQRMAAAAAVSGLPLCAPSPMSLSAQLPVDMKPFQLPPSTLPSTQSVQLVPGDRGSTSTPQKSASSTLAGRRDVLHGGLSSPLSTTAVSDMDVRRSFLARLTSFASGANNQTNIATDETTTGALAVPRALAPAAGNSDVSWITRTVINPSPCLRSKLDGVSNNHQAHNGRDLSKCTSISEPVGHTLNDDHPLDLTAKTNVTAMPREQAPDIYQPDERDRIGTSIHDQLTVRKTSRRKGVAHKLDTTCINEWPASDVTNEPFDLVPLSTSPPTATGLTVLQRSSSPQVSLPDPRGSNGVPQNAATSNGSVPADDEVGDSDAAEKHNFKSSARLQRQLEIAEVGCITSGDADEADAAVVDVSGCRSLEGVDAGRVSTPRKNECRHCGFVFKHPAMFDIHMGFHKFDDPWRCNRCGHRCTDSVDFNRHIATAPHLDQV